MSIPQSHLSKITRRGFLGSISASGLSSALFAKELSAGINEEQSGELDTNAIEQAERIAGLDFTQEQREMMLEGLKEQRESFTKLREFGLDNSVYPALCFNPVPPGMTFEKEQRPLRVSKVENKEVPKDLEEAAFWPVTHLAELVRTRKITSTALTKMYLGRLKRYDSKLKCVVTLTEELAIEQAKRADMEIAEGKYRGPLHGIPWGAKDLLSTKRYKTTWGATPYKNQMIDIDATVVERLERAGAVLTAKLTLGALAWGDVWFGGQTKNPWNIEEGSSGSSAGPASATASGLLGFSIGSETWGSIVSPCTVCGVTGLRPTFGRVSRHGAMALSWSMDKVGPICRSVEDCALVLDVIRGSDGKDTTVMDVPFNWDASIDIKGLKVGYLKEDFEKSRSDEKWKQNDLDTLNVMCKLGVKLVPISLPDLPVEAISFILNVEAAAAFAELTLTDKDSLLVRQVKNAWPNVFRKSWFVPAVEYIQANRVRTMVMQAMQGIMSEIDAYIAPSWEGNNLLLTNLTGHPALVVPNGFNKSGTPTTICFMGGLFGESAALSLGKAYQDATDFHMKKPSI
jgi:Asp-tRNA(Asn)/Glu-tRNA(Gln) amidotransferase A subunit family amidase